MILTPAILLALATLNVTIARDASPLLAAWALALHLGPDSAHPTTRDTIEETAARGLALALCRGKVDRAEECAANVLDPETAMERGLDRLWRLTKGAAGQPMPSRSAEVSA